MENIIISREELLTLNEKMLGRGRPVQDDGIGYNKADYGACATYFYGLSDAQYADLSKRLVKYSKTQLDIDKDQMKETAKYYAEIAGYGDRSDGISLNIAENGTLISFRYNETFIETIKKQPKRRWDAENKNWVVPNENVMKVLKALRDVGADVKNAIEYAESHPLVKEAEIAEIKKEIKKTEVNCVTTDGYAFVKFNYNAEIVAEIKKLTYRKFNPEDKSWKIELNDLNSLQENLKPIANFAGTITI